MSYCLTFWTRPSGVSAYVRTSAGRALQAQAAAGIDAAAATASVADVHTVLGEGAKQLEDAFAKAMTGKAKSSAEGCKGNLSDHQA